MVMEDLLLQMIIMNTKRLKELDSMEQKLKIKKIDLIRNIMQMKMVLIQDLMKYKRLY